MALLSCMVCCVCTFFFSPFFLLCTFSYLKVYDPFSCCDLLTANHNFLKVTKHERLRFISYTFLSSLLGG